MVVPTALKTRFAEEAPTASSLKTLISSSRNDSLALGVGVDIFTGSI